jgi:hypothetical protein
MRGIIEVTDDAQRDNLDHETAGPQATPGFELRPSPGVRVQKRLTCFSRAGHNG